MAATKSSKMYWIHVATFLIITFGVGFLPPFAQITPLGMKVLGVFLGVIYCIRLAKFSCFSCIGRCWL